MGRVDFFIVNDHGHTRGSLRRCRVEETESVELSFVGTSSLSKKAWRVTWIPRNSAGAIMEIDNLEEREARAMYEDIITGNTATWRFVNGTWSRR